MLETRILIICAYNNYQPCKDWGNANPDKTVYKTGVHNLPEIYDPPKNSKDQKGDMKQVTNGESQSIRHH